MDLPISMNGHSYYEHLRDFRDKAFVESHWVGRRRKIGRFTSGVVHARWESESGGRAHLMEQGLRIGNECSRVYPTTLRLTNGINKGLEVVTYEMNLDGFDGAGIVRIFHNFFTQGSFKEVARAELSKRADQKHGLALPSDEQRELLYFEMQRGASGLYPVAHFDESDD